MSPSTLATAIDLTDMDLFAEREPYELYDELRAHSPVWRHPETPHNDEPFWLVTSHELITKAHRIGPGAFPSDRSGPQRHRRDYHR